jgi:hypothetical protein
MEFKYAQSFVCPVQVNLPFLAVYFALKGE